MDDIRETIAKLDDDLSIWILSLRDELERLSNVVSTIENRVDIIQGFQNTTRNYIKDILRNQVKDDLNLHRAHINVLTRINKSAFSNLERQVVELKRENNFTIINIVISGLLIIVAILHTLSYSMQAKIIAVAVAIITIFTLVSKCFDTNNKVEIRREDISKLQEITDAQRGVSNAFFCSQTV